MNHKNNTALLKCLSLMALSGILTSCASHWAAHHKPEQINQTQTHLTPEAAWKQNQLTLNRFQNWDAQGRIAVSRKKEGESASFSWQYCPEHFFLKLFGPFGSGAMELDGMLSGPNQHVTLRHGNKIQYAKTAEDLLYQQVKWRVPLSGLTYWIKGLPVPNQAIEDLNLNTDGSISKLTQLGWEITYAKYHDFNTPFEKIKLPTKIYLISNELEVKLAIRHWKPLEK